MMHRISLFYVLFCGASSLFAIVTSYPLQSNLVGVITPKSIPPYPMMQLTVEIPPASVEYGKGLDVKSGGHFTLNTPKENYQYTSSGCVDFRCVNVRYFMQSSYEPNLMCFYLHFVSFKNDQANWRTYYPWVQN